jgi:amino acid transporter
MAEVGQGRTLTRLEITGIAWAVNIFSGVINTVGTKAVGRMSTFSVWWTLGGTVVLVITLLVKAPVKVSFCQLTRSLSLTRIVALFGRTLPSSCSQIFKSKLAHLVNKRGSDWLGSFTGWESKGFVVLLGFLQVRFNTINMMTRVHFWLTT